MEYKNLWYFVTILHTCVVVLLEADKKEIKMLSLYLAYMDNDDDKKLFEEMFFDYRKQMVSYAAFVLNNEKDSEDAVHNVFLSIAKSTWDTVKAIDNPVDLRNYLLKATKHASINIIKSNKKENVSLDTISEYDFDVTDNISDDEFITSICERIEYKEIIECISKLSEKYKNALYYHFVLELSINDTAKSLNQTIAATQKQLVRGKKMLLNLLGIKGDENNGNEQR